MTVAEFLDRCSALRADKRVRERIGRATMLVIGLLLLFGCFRILNVSNQLAKEEAAYRQKNPTPRGVKRTPSGAGITGLVAWAMGIVGGSLVILTFLPSRGRMIEKFLGDPPEH